MAPSAQLDNTGGPSSATMDLLDMLDAPMDPWTDLDGHTHDVKAATHHTLVKEKVLTPSSSSAPGSGSSSSSSLASLRHTSDRPVTTSHVAKPSESSSSVTPRVSKSTTDHRDHDPIQKECPLVVVLVDGNTFHFRADELRKGREGALSAYTRAWDVVPNEIPWYHGHPCQIIFHIYADFRKLAKQLTPHGNSQPCLNQIRSFASGLNSQEGFDFFDAGSEPGAVLQKMQEHCGFFSSHPDCQDIVLAAHQSDWTSLLDIREPKDRFNLLFASDDQKTPPPSAWKDYWHVDLSGVFQYNDQGTPSGSFNSSKLQTTTVAATPSTQSKHNTETVLINNKDQRVDPQLAPYTFDEWQLYHNIKRTKEPCRYYHLNECTSQDCQYDHGRLPEAMMLVLLHITRATPCDSGPSCRDPECPYGHHCSRLGCDMRKCRFPPAAHGEAFDPARATARPAASIANAATTTATNTATNTTTITTTTLATISTTTLAPQLAATAKTSKIADVSSPSIPNVVPNVSRVLVNSKKYRIDTPIPPPSKMDKIRYMQIPKTPMPCPHFHLSHCGEEDCELSHAPLDAAMRNILAIGARQLPCENGANCRDEGCFFGHHCQIRYCDNEKCKFPRELHNIDRATALSPPAATTALNTVPPRPARKIVKALWSSKPKDTIEYVSAAGTNRPGSHHSSPARKQKGSRSRQTTPSQRSNSPPREVKSINSWKAFAEASHVDATKQQHIPAITTLPAPATAAPPAFDLIDFDFEDRADVGDGRVHAVDFASALRRTAMARSGTSSPRQATEQSPARPDPDLLNTPEAFSDEVDAAEISSKKPAEALTVSAMAFAETNTMFEDIAQLMAGNFFGTPPVKKTNTPTPAAKNLRTPDTSAPESSSSDDIVRPWLSTFDVVDDVEEYAQGMMEREYEQEQRVDSDVESEL